MKRADGGSPVWRGGWGGGSGKLILENVFHLFWKKEKFPEKKSRPGRAEDFFESQMHFLLSERAFRVEKRTRFFGACGGLIVLLILHVLHCMLILLVNMLKFRDPY